MSEYDLCDRCKQPVPPKARRCPQCGTPYSNTRSLTLWFGAAVTVTLMLVIGLMVYSFRSQ